MRANAKVKPPDIFVIESILKPERTDRGVHTDAGTIPIPIARLASSSCRVAQDGLAAVQVCSIIKEECALRIGNTHLTICRRTLTQALLAQNKKALQCCSLHPRRGIRCFPCITALVHGKPSTSGTICLPHARHLSCLQRVLDSAFAHALEKSTDLYRPKDGPLNCCCASNIIPA